MRHAENIRVKRAEWGANRLEAHLGDVMRHLGEAFARAGAAAGGSRNQAMQLPKLTPAGIDLLQVGCVKEVVLQRSRAVFGAWQGQRQLLLDDPISAAAVSARAPND
jgi:hypothetical protein